MTAASPGVIALFLENERFADYEKYLEALADVMKKNIKPCATQASSCNSIAPISAVGRHTRFAQNTTAEFVKVVELHVAAINRAVANIPPDKSGCICAGADSGAA